ncbi:putative glycosyltransferase [Sesamum angolense]|uniref:Glycosyltransferase n=1 Tax=Sesamum angolense TaxID=2727404 RepID=A0AAE2BWM1_9LAMI|nr:putative glycosyltransferase [Sesamum angolense]
MFRLDWRKLISIFVILTVVSVLIQISRLPYPLTELIFPPPTLVSSYKSFNSAILGKQLQTNNENGSPTVLLDSSDQVNQSLASSKKKWKESQQRRRRNNLTSSNMLAPSSHPSVKNLPSRIEGPYTLTEHEELTKNTIKALCNADVSQWIFNGAKDVSLPETYIRNSRNPIKYLGGRRVSQRPILAFFAGYNHGRVRPILLKYWGDKDEDMRIYGPLPNRVSKVISYRGHMKSSKYCICPMGLKSTVRGVFLVKSAYLLARLASNPSNSGVVGRGSCSKKHGWSFIWDTRADTKVLVFAWKCCREALPTISNLHRLDSACVLCDQQEEDIVHVLAESSSARFTWALSLVPYRSVDAWMRCAHESLSQIDFVFFCYRVLAVVG